MKIDPHQPIRQIAIEIDGAAQIFEKYEIDYYKGGEQSLKEACLGIGAPLEKVESELGEKNPCRFPGASGNRIGHGRPWPV